VVGGQRHDLLAQHRAPKSAIAMLMASTRPRRVVRVTRRTCVDVADHDLITGGGHAAPVAVAIAAAILIANFRNFMVLSS